MTDPRSKGVRRTLATNAWEIPLVLVLVLLGSGLSASVGSAVPTAPPAPSTSLANHLAVPAPATTAPSLIDGHPARAARSATAFAPPSPPTSGRGLFFNSSQIAQAPSTSCAVLLGYACQNDSYDPSINISDPQTGSVGTAGDVLGVAFTQVTNDSPCANVTTWAETEVGFAYSTDFGGTWSTPVYLGLTNCTMAALLPSAYQPTLTSLSNGTFVLAYIAYNISNIYTAWYEQDLGGAGGYYSVQGAALVLTESYDGGVHWTQPDVLNESLNLNVLSNCCDANDTHAFTPQRPWITAIGDTVYLAWTNDTYSAGFDFYCEVALYEYSACYGAGSSQVHLLVSKDGGTSWLPPSNLTTVRPAGNLTISVGENPYVLVTPNGTVYVAYVTDYYLPVWAVRQSTGNYLANGSIEIAESSDNGSSFRYTTAATGLLMYAANPPFQGGQWGLVVAPQLAWSPLYSQLYLTWSMDDWGVDVQCPLTCPDDSIYQNVYFTNSSDGGVSWSAYHLVSPALNDSGGAAAWNPALAVLPNGQVDIATAFTDLNQSVNYCYGASFDYWFYCGPVREEFLASTDNGTSFGSPILISDNISANPGSDPSGWYDTATVVNGSFYAAWAQKYAATGPGNISLWPGTCCGYALAHSQIAVSHLVEGPGLTLYYNETGVPPGFNWSVNVMGNLYEAVAPASITVTGVASGENISWIVEPVAGSSWGYRYFSNQTPVSPDVFTRSSTIYENFTEEVYISISADPYGIQCPTAGNQAQFYICWDPAQSYYYHFDHNIQPFVGPGWIDYGVPFTLNASPANMCFSSPTCPIYTSWLNLTFEAWTGDGAGSANSSRSAITIVPKGPINETATFQVIGICSNANTGGFAPTCSLNESLVFHEIGLPAGTLWNVTIENNAGLAYLGTGVSPTLIVTNEATTGLVNYTIWTVPSSAPGEFWIPTAAPGNPVELPVERVINVTFTLSPASSGAFAVALNESGLPEATTAGWTFDFGARDIGLRSAATALSVTGGNYSIAVPPVYFANGTGYYASSVSIQRYLVNGSAPFQITTLPSNVSFDGPSIVTVVFAPLFFLTIATTFGGTATPGSEWVPSDHSVQLNATANGSYHFVGWSGGGAGATFGSSPNLTVRLAGPVTETATFAWNGPSLWTLHVATVGLPAGTGFSLAVGNTTYSASGSFNVTGLMTGDYALAVPFAYSNTSALTRYLGTITGSTLVFAGSSDLSISGNGTVNLTFQTEYQVTYSATAGGTISPAPGSYWEAAGVPLPSTATVGSGDRFVGWVGAGMGSVSGPAISISALAEGPITELAQFVPTGPSVPATYSLNVSETGLPNGVTWGLQVGLESTTGAGGMLSITGLNGSYPVSVPTVTAGYGIQYVPTDLPTTDEVVTSDQTLTIAFQEQFWVSVSFSAGGNAGPSSGWVDAGASVSLTVSPSAGWNFNAWQGSGPGSYAGNSTRPSFTPTGAVNETAGFLPVPVASPSGSASGAWLPIGLFVVLILVGAVVGVLLSRRPPRRSASDEPVEPTSESWADPETETLEPSP